jgi:hypothetical protein
MPPAATERSSVLLSLPAPHRARSALSRLRTAAALLGGFCLLAGSAGAQSLLFDLGFETGDFTGYQFAVNSDGNYKGNGPDKPTISTAQVCNGTYASKHEIIASNGSNGPSTSYRSELKVMGSGDAVTYGQEYWYGWAIYLPTSWIPDPTRWEIITQVHQPVQEFGGRSEGPPIVFEFRPNNGGVLSFRSQWMTDPANPMTSPTASTSYLPVGTLNLGQWNRFVMNIKYDPMGTEGGFVKVWINDVLKVDHTGPNVFPADLKPYFKMGIYKGWGATAPHPTVTSRTLWTDSFKMGLASAGVGYNDVVPPASGEPPVTEPLLAPANLVATAAIGSLRVNLAWPDVAHETHYRLERKAGAGSFGALSPPVLPATGSVAHSDTTVLPGTSYTYRIRAENALGHSSWTDSNTVTTPPSGGPTQYEVNALTISASSGKGASAFTVAAASNADTLRYESNQNNDYVTFDVIAPATATYDIAARFQRTPTSGRIQLAVDGEDQGAMADLYNSTGTFTTISFDSKSLTAGIHTFNFTVVGTSANGRKITFDTISLTPIGPAQATVTLGDLVQTYDGTPKSASVTTNPAALAVVTTYDGNATPPINAGSYMLESLVEDVNYAGYAADTFTITPAPAAIAFGGLRQSYDGAPKGVTTTTTPADVAVTVTYGGGTTPPTLPGAYDVEATIDDANYSGAAIDTLSIGITALVRHAPTLNGAIDGSLQLLTGENTTLNGNAWISGDLLAPGMPAVQLNGHPTFTGAIDAEGASDPANYQVTLNGNAVLRHLVRRVDPIAMPTVAAPAAPAGTDSVTLNQASQNVANWSTLLNLTLNGNAGVRTIPPGAYGNLTVNGNSSVILGIADATEPALYSLQNLVLNGNSTLQVVGPVILTLANGVTLNGSAGSSAHPEWLTLRIASGGATLNGNVAFHGRIVAPSGTVTINGNSTVQGEVISDRLTLNGNALLEHP